MFYRWQKQFFDNRAAAFDIEGKDDSPCLDKRAALEKKLAPKNEVLSELMEEHIKSKRTLGTLRGYWVPPDLRDEMDAVRLASADKAIDDICRYPLRQTAADAVNRQLRAGVSDQAPAERAGACSCGSLARRRLGVHHQRGGAASQTSNNLVDGS